MRAALTRSSYSGWTLTVRPAEGRHLERDLLAVDADGPHLAVEDAAPDGEVADADRRRLPEHGLDQGLPAVVRREQGELRPETVLLHDDGGEGGVQGPHFEGSLEEMGQELGRGVVDRRLDHEDALGLFEGPGLAAKGPQDVGDLGEFLGPRAAADPVIDELRELGEAAGQGRDDGRAGRGDELRLDPGRVNRGVLQELGHGRGRDGQAAVRRFHPARADVERRAIDVGDTELVEEERGPHDVDERVVGPGFVEMGFLELAAVDLGLGLEKPLENRQGPVLDGRPEPAPEDDPLDVGERAFDMFVAADLHVDLDGGEAAPADPPDGDLDGQTEPGHPLFEEARVDAQVEEGAEDHVAARPRRGVEIDVSHSPLRISFSP